MSYPIVPQAFEHFEFNSEEEKIDWFKNQESVEMNPVESQNSKNEYLYYDVSKVKFPKGVKLIFRLETKLNSPRHSTEIKAYPYIANKNYEKDKEKYLQDMKKYLEAEGPCLDCGESISKLNDTIVHSLYNAQYDVSGGAKEYIKIKNIADQIQDFAEKLFEKNGIELNNREE